MKTSIIVCAMIFFSRFLSPGTGGPGADLFVDAEAYYTIFFPPPADSVRVKVDVKVSNWTKRGIEKGCPVFLLFKEVDGALTCCEAVENADEAGDALVLRGKVIGHRSSPDDHQINLLMVSFDFSPVRINNITEALNLHCKEGQTDIVRLHLVKEGSFLKFSFAEYVKTIDKKPVRYK